MKKARRTMIERYSFVAITTSDLKRARLFWVDHLGFPITEEKPEDHFIVDAGGLRLCVDLENQEDHKLGGSDPVIGFKVESVDQTLAKLSEYGIYPTKDPESSVGYGRWAELRDPDGHIIILTEGD